MKPLALVMQQEAKALLSKSDHLQPKQALTYSFNIVPRNRLGHCLEKLPLICVDAIAQPEQESSL